MVIEEFARTIESREDFDKFIGLYRADFYNHKNEWDNQTLEHFIEGLRGFLNDMEGYYAGCSDNLDVNQPSWRLFAEILLAARVYE